MAVTPLLLLEMNEVPWRVVDRALGDSRLRNTRRLFESAATYTTVARDVGELSPWVTWPSLHRGITNVEHKIRNLGQEVSTFRGTPIWTEFRRRGLPIGVCGSMQSWPPLDPGEGGFYIPDTFAHDEQVIPHYLEPIQRFNLGQVRKNGLVVRDAALFNQDIIALLPAIARARIRPHTLARIAKHLVSERFDKTRLARRPIFQTLIFWDVFKSLFERGRPPAFSTFFTNHVAGVMHRYWNDVFPEDFPERPADAPHPHAATMDFALCVMDEIVGDALAFQARHPDLVVVFATSMGQAAVRRERKGYAFSLTEVDKLLAQIGAAAHDFTPLLAMVPQVAIDVRNAAKRVQWKETLESSETASGARLFSIDEIGESLSISIRTPPRDDKDHGGFYIVSPGQRRFVTWADAGVSVHNVEPGTAYHIPEGVLAIAGRTIAPTDARTRIPATDVKSLLLSLSGIQGEARDRAQEQKAQGATA